MEHTINLEPYRGGGSNLFTGRPQGKQVRAKLKLEDFDKDENTQVRFVIPVGTTSFNPSFFLGLLFESIKYLGQEKFNSKYTFEIEDNNPEVKKVIEKNIMDGMRNAINELADKTGLKYFWFNNK